VRQVQQRDRSWAKDRTYTESGARGRRHASFLTALNRRSLAPGPAKHSSQLDPQVVAPLPRNHREKF
jgi:hypothetical protein